MADLFVPKPMSVAVEAEGKKWALLGGSGDGARLSALSDISLDTMGTDSYQFAGADENAQTESEAAHSWQRFDEKGGRQKFDLEVHPAEQKARAPVSTLRWALMTSVMFIYAFINTGMALYVLPVESRRMHPGAGGGPWVSVCIAACGVAQLVNPVAGKVSDRHASALGKRRPFIIAGTGIAITFLLGIWLASSNKWPIVFICSLLVAEVGLNTAYSAQCGVPADLQAASAGPLSAGGSKEEADANGVCSGVVALHSVLGSLCAMFLMVATQRLPVQVQYPIYIAGLALCCAVVCFFAREKPSHTGPKADPLTCTDVLRGFTIDTARDSDFLWVCLGRMCYYVVTSVLVFQLYYLEDMIHISDDGDRNFKLGTMVVSAQAIGLVCSVPFGRLSNGTGRKKIIYAACVVMSLAAILQVLAPKVGPHGSWPMVWLSAAFAGLGNSAYLSVDYALALDCMPQGKTAAEAFGLWGIAGFAGSTIGPLFGGLVLHLTASSSTEAGAGGGREDKVHYSYEGYALLFLVLGVLGNLLVVLCTSRINAAK